MGMWLLIGVVVSAVLVLAFWRLAKRSTFAGRKPVPLEDLYAAVREQISFEVFVEVWALLGRRTPLIRVCCDHRTRSVL
jgi:hypothetical protein